MATYDQLPVYKVAYKLLMQIYQLCGNMERTYRYTLGERIINDVIDLLQNIYRANCVPDKIAFIKAARENILTVRLLLRVAHDSGQVGLKPFISASEQIESISKQLTAWEKSYSKNVCPKT